MKIAVIPARGGSKRIPRKNIKPFVGKPMISYAIAAAQASRQFDEIIVTTDDEEIAQVARSFGAKVPFMRPAHLADDMTATVPVIAHAISACDELGWHAGHVCCIYPCVPLLDAHDIAGAFEIVSAGSTHYAFPLVPFPSAVQRAITRNTDETASPLWPEFVSTRTQDLDSAYYDAGQFYWGHRDLWLAGKAIHPNGKTIVISPWRVVDIDTEEDWVRAEYLHRALELERRSPAEESQRVR